MNQRIYTVSNKTDGESTTRLVMATNPAQAMRHVAHELFGVKAATSIEVAELMGAGVKLEKSKAEPDQMELPEAAEA